MSNTSLLGSYGGLGSSGLTFRNILINGEVTRINQRGFGGNWAALSVGEYGYDRWKKAGTDTMSQVVEEGNFIPGAQYTLSGTNVTTQTLTAPSSGHWTITVQQTARFVMLEAGPVATPFEHRPYGLELQLCQRYFYQIAGNGTDGEVIGLGQGNNTTVARFVVNFPTNMRVKDVSPAIKNSASNFRIYSGSSNITTINTIAGSSRASTWAGHLYVVCGGGLTANSCYSLGFNGEDAISFNAEL